MVPDFAAFPGVKYYLSMFLLVASVYPSLFVSLPRAWFVMLLLRVKRAWSSERKKNICDRLIDSLLTPQTQDGRCLSVLTDIFITPLWIYNCHEMKLNLESHVIKRNLKRALNASPVTLPFWKTLPEPPVNILDYQRKEKMYKLATNCSFLLTLRDVFMTICFFSWPLWVWTVMEDGRSSSAGRFFLFKRVFLLTVT